MFIASEHKMRETEEQDEMKRSSIATNYASSILIENVLTLTKVFNDIFRIGPLFEDTCLYKLATFVLQDLKRFLT